jgi:hypothetical protein
MKNQIQITKTFKRGQKVKSTQAAVEWGIFKDMRKGKVVGFSKRVDGEDMIRVVQNGQKTPCTYHHSFWE